MISVITPVFNEELVVRELVKRIMKALEACGEKFEIVCVDDGSTDNTLNHLIELKKVCPELKIISLSRNFGHQAAYSAGLVYAKGDHIAMLDGDLQDPPELLQNFYSIIKEKDCDLVTGRRVNDPINSGKKVLTKSFHKIFKKLSNIQKIENEGNFCFMKRNVALAINSMQEKNRYIPGLRAFAGYKNYYFDYQREERAKGGHKMSLPKLFLLALDAIFSFSKWPIKLCLYLGIIGLITVFCAVVYIVLSKVLGFAPLGWSSTMMSLYFLGAVQLTFLGVIGEYVYRIYKETQNRPLFFIREIIE